MPTYIIYSIIAAVLNSFTGIYQKIVSKYSVKNFYAYSFYSYLLPVIFVPFVFLMFGYTSPIPALGYLIPQVLSFFIAATLLYYVIFLNDASNINPLFPLKMIFVPFVTYFLLGEKFSPIVYVFICVIITGGVLVSIDEKFSLNSFFKKGNLILIASLFFFAFSDAFIGKVTHYMSSYQDLAWQTLMLAPLAFIFLIFKGKNKISADAKALVSIFSMNLMLMIFFGFLYAAFAQNVTISDALAMLNGPLILIIITVLGKIRPKFLENHTMKVYLIRFSGSLLMYGAAVGIILSL